MIKKYFIHSIIIILFSPLFLSAGLQMISDFNSIYADNWKTEFEEGTGKGTNYIVTSDKFQGTGCVEFRGDYIGGAGWENKCLWKWVSPSALNWSNYGKFVVAVKVRSMYQSGGADWQKANYSLNFGISVKEPWGDLNWNGEVWSYYMTNSSPFTYDPDTWHLMEIDMRQFYANNFNTRFNEFQDESYDLDTKANHLPQKDVREIDIFYKSGFSGNLNDQRIRFDFMGVLSTPYSLVSKQTDYFPVTLQWNDVAANHPVFQMQMVTNNTNSARVVNQIINNAESLSSYTFNALNSSLKPRNKYKWHLRAGYIINSTRGFTSDSYKKLNVNKTYTTIPASTSMTLWSYYSRWAEYTNNGIKPFQQSLFSPGDESTNFTVSDLPFSWDDLSQEGAEFYRITVSSNQAFTKIITTATLMNNSYTLNDAADMLISSSNYYYSVAAGFTNFHKNLVWDKVATNKFTFFYNSPSLISPADNTTIKESESTFSWGNVYTGVNYTLQLSAYQNFSTIIDTFSGTALSQKAVSFSLDTYKNKNFYYWRVLASCGAGTKYSGVNYFYLDIPNPAGALTENSIFPTVVSTIEDFNLKIIVDNDKEIEKVQVLYFNPFNQLVAEQNLKPAQFPGGIITSTASDLGLNKGYHFVYTINYYKDLTTERSKVIPLVIK